MKLLPLITLILTIIILSSCSAPYTESPSESSSQTSPSNSNIDSSNTEKIIPTFYISLSQLAKEEAKNYDYVVLDLFDNSKESIQNLKKNNATIICYFSAGTAENWREDYNEFSEESKGEAHSVFTDEYYIDIRKEEVKTIMKKRLDLAQEKGCDGVDPDNVDAYNNPTGFDLTYENQLFYNFFLSEEAKKRGLLVGLKNDMEQIEDLEEHFDFAINELCFSYDECDYYKTFLKNDKPVFVIEYSKENKEVWCEDAKEKKISVIFDETSLGGEFETC